MKNRIKKNIEKNFVDPNFDVNKLAENLGICRDNLNTIFQFNFNCTPHYYIESIRICFAKTFLLEGYKIIDVCKKIGYSNKKTFHVAFKKRMNVTPMTFVKKSIGKK